MDDYPVIYTLALEPRWGDMDALGHVNNTVYFRYMEEVRVRWMKSINYTFDAEGVGPVIVNTSLDFMRPIVFPDTVEIDFSVKPPGRSSVTTLYTFRIKQEVVASGSAVIVWVNYSLGKSVPLPRLVLDALSSVS